MKKRQNIQFDIEIDKLTNSIENAISGEVFDTLITRLHSAFMVNFKKMDDKDFVFIKKSLDEKEEKEFSDFLKNRKLLKKRPRKHKNKTAIAA